MTSGARVPRVAVIGAGHLGRLHAEKLARLAGEGCVELAGIVDVDPARRPVAEGLGVPFAAAVGALANDIDAAVIATPTATHADIARLALERGWHVLVEKPLAHSAAAALGLVELAARRDRILQVGHSERFNAAVAAALRVADRPRYVVAERLGPFTGRSAQDDVVADLMVHDLDILRCLNPSPVVEIRAVGVPVLTGAVDMASARLELADGSVAQLSAGRVSLEPSRKLRLFTVERYLSIDCLAQQVKSVRRLPAKDGGDWPEIVGEPIEVTPNDPLLDQARDFIRCVREGAAPRVDGAAGAAAVVLADRIRAELRVPLS